MINYLTLFENGENAIGLLKIDHPYKDIFLSVLRIDFFKNLDVFLRDYVYTARIHQTGHTIVLAIGLIESSKKGH